MAGTLGGGLYYDLYLLMNAHGHFCKQVFDFGGHGFSPGFSRKLGLAALNNARQAFHCIDAECPSRGIAVYTCASDECLMMLDWAIQ